MIKLAIFASGTGTNAARIIEYFKPSTSIAVGAVISNQSNAKVLEKAAAAKVNTAVFSNRDFAAAKPVIELLNAEEIDWIVLAGFLQKIPEEMIRAFPNRIINIHPALLPKYGGKGMYGMRVHQAVVDNKEKESGISIHLVNKDYDKGKILFQKACSLESSDTAIEVAQKVQQLEHHYFPLIIEKTIKQHKNGN